MPEDKTQDSTPDSTEKKAIPKPNISADSEDQPSSEVSADAIAKQVLESLDSKLDELVSRKVQSSKDVRFAKIQKQIGRIPTLEEALAAVAEGGDPKEILAAAQQESSEARLTAVEAALQSSSIGNSESDAAFSRAVVLLTDAGYANDPEVYKMMEKGFSTNEVMLFEVAEFIVQKQLKPTAPAAAATQPASAGTATAGKVDVEALSAEYQDLRQKNDWSQKVDGDKTIHQRMQEISQELATAE